MFAVVSTWWTFSILLVPGGGKACDGEVWHDRARRKKTIDRQPTCDTIRCNWKKPRMAFSGSAVICVTKHLLGMFRLLLTRKFKKKFEAWTICGHLIHQSLANNCLRPNPFFRSQASSTTTQRKRDANCCVCVACDMWPNSALHTSTEIPRTWCGNVFINFTLGSTLSVSSKNNRSTSAFLKNYQHSNETTWHSTVVLGADMLRLPCRYLQITLARWRG